MADRVAKTDLFFYRWPKKSNKLSVIMSGILNLNNAGIWYGTRQSELQNIGMGDCCCQELK